jgi:hypothetical protein
MYRMVMGPSTYDTRCGMSRFWWFTRPRAHLAADSVIRALSRLGLRLSKFPSCYLRLSAACLPALITDTDDTKLSRDGTSARVPR